jgi:hypothetical protein
MYLVLLNTNWKILVIVRDFPLAITAFRGVIGLIWPDPRQPNWADDPSEQPFQPLLTSVSLEKKSFYGFPTITERLLDL